MNWDDLRLFLALVRNGSLAAAARKLKIDHTTVGRRIAALEQELGVRLFDRLPRGSVLTSDGERIAAAAERMEEEAFTVERLARGSGLSGKVRISAPPNFAAHFLAPRLNRLRPQHPAITLEVVGENQPISLARRDADIALRQMRPTGESLVARRVGTIAYGLYGAPAYLTGRSEAEWDFVGYDDSLEQVPQQHWLRRMAGDKDFVLRSNDLTVLFTAVAGGMGVGALPCYLETVALAGSGPALVRLPAAEQPPPREIWLVLHQDVRRSPRVRAVADFLAELITSERPLLEGR